jgi:2-iminobutanoate/2-iminopropanoate deaminase
LSGWPALGLALFVAGGVSNWIDRVTQGRVVDFLNVGVGPVRTGVFNVADLAIMVGAVAFACGELSRRPSDTNGDKMPRQIVYTLKAATPPATYSQAVKAAGLVFVSGTAPHDPANGQIKGAMIQDRRASVDKHRGHPRRGRQLLDRIVSATIVLADEDDFAGMNEDAGFDGFLSIHLPGRVRNCPQKFPDSKCPSRSSLRPDTAFATALYTTRTMAKIQLIPTLATMADIYRLPRDAAQARPVSSVTSNLFRATMDWSVQPDGGSSRARDHGTTTRRR